MVSLVFFLVLSAVKGPMVLPLKTSIKVFELKNYVCCGVIFSVNWKLMFSARIFPSSTGLCHCHLPTDPSSLHWRGSWHGPGFKNWMGLSSKSVTLGRPLLNESYLTSSLCMECLFFSSSAAFWLIFSPN